MYNSSTEVVIAGMARTPIGDFLGGLAGFSAIELGNIAAKAAIERSGIKPEQIEDVTAGMVYKVGLGGNPARQIQVAMGIPVKAAAVTIEQQCASSMRALEVACQQLVLGKSRCTLVCGMESMTNTPYLLMQARKGLCMGASQVEDDMWIDGLTDVFSKLPMALTAERVAEQHGVTRKEQDEYASLSHSRAVNAAENGYFNEEMIPIEIKSKKGPRLMDKDEHARLTSVETLGNMKAVFKKDGTVTAGNASGISDGACAMVIMTADYAKQLGIKPLARILSTVTYGVEPEVMGIGPVYAIPQAIEEAGLKTADIDYYEINEAFAAQVLACLKVLKLDLNKVNANGAGISLGHPVGMTGIRLIVSGYYEMKRRGVKYGCASLCAGGGPGMAVVFERLV